MLPHPPYNRRRVTKIEPPRALIRHPVKGSLAAFRAALRYIKFNIFIFVGIQIESSIPVPILFLTLIIMMILDYGNSLKKLKTAKAIAGRTGCAVWQT
jgi:hypothetical protein